MQPVSGVAWPVDTYTHPEQSDARTKYSATGTRTRVARVRAEYPNQLDYSGSCIQVCRPFPLAATGSLWWSIGSRLWGVIRHVCYVNSEQGTRTILPRSGSRMVMTTKRFSRGHATLLCF